MTDTMLDARQCREDFESASHQYDEHVNAWALAAESLRDAQAALRTAKQAKDDAEMMAVLDPSVDGKNAEIRAAQVAALLDATGNYGAAVEDATREVAKWQDACESEMQRMSGAKAQMRFADAWVRFATERE